MKERIAYNPNPATEQRPGRKAHVLPLRAIWLGLALSLMGSGSVRGQITTISQGSQLPSPQVVGSMADPNDGPRNSDPALEQERIQELKIMRRSEMVSDTNKLLKLTVRLNAEIEQSHAKSLTHQQLRMLAKIEKLAKSVRQNMSSAFQPSP